MMINRWLSGVMFLSLLPFLFTFSSLTQAAEKPSDVRIIVDISGSMKETDPANLRVPALNLLVELLPDNARSGVWTFGHYVNMMVPLDLVDKGWRERAKEQAKSINSVGLYTNLTGALEKASWQLAADSGFDQSVILLTDGRIDMPADAGRDINEAERKRLFDKVLPRYTEAGARVHTVGLSAAADTELLQQIALETGGMYLEASDADALLKAFLKAFDRAVPVEQVPMDDNLFEIDASVSEFTALVFRKAGGRQTRLISPAGVELSAASAQAMDNVRWHEDVNFDLITVSEPEVGSWRADADIDPDNRVQILSDLTLSVEGLPNTLFSGTPVDLAMALYNAGEVVSEKAILGLTDFTLKVTAPDGRSGSKLLSDPEALPEDGIFRESMTRLSQIGEYRFEVTAVGRTFQRRQVLTASLMEPLAVEVIDVAEEERVHVQVLAKSDNVDTTLSRVIAKVTYPDASSLINTMAYDPALKGWQMDLTAEKGPGRYELVLNIRGVTAGGTTFKSHPEEIVRDFPLIKPQAIAPEELPSEEEAGNTAGASDDSEAAQPTPEPGVEEKNEQPPAEKPEEAAEPEAVQPEPEIVPDLAKRFAEQADVVEEEAEDEGIAWWVYLLLALGNLAIFGGAGAWWFMRRKKTAKAEPEAEVKGGISDELAGDDGLSDDDFAGDFDDFSDGGEEEIPLPEDDAPAAPARAPSTMGSDADIDVSLDDDFDLDAGDAEEASDDWGEFDADEDNKS